MSLNDDYKNQKLQRNKKTLMMFIFYIFISLSLSTGAPTPVASAQPSSRHQGRDCRPGAHLVLVIDGLSPGWIMGVQLGVPPGQAQQHRPLQIHPQLGAQVSLGSLQRGSTGVFQHTDSTGSLSTHSRCCQDVLWKGKGLLDLFWKQFDHRSEF